MKQFWQSFAEHVNSILTKQLKMRYENFEFYWSKSIEFISVLDVTQTIVIIFLTENKRHKDKSRLVIGQRNDM